MPDSGSRGRSLRRAPEEPAGLAAVLPLLQHSRPDANPLGIGIARQKR